MSTHKTIRVHVICTNADVEPDVFTTPVTVSEEEYALGEHYRKAEKIATAEGFEAPFICLEDHDLPRILKGLDRFYPKNRVCVQYVGDHFEIMADRPYEIEAVFLDQTWEEGDSPTRDLLTGERLEGLASKVDLDVPTVDMGELFENAISRTH